MEPNFDPEDVLRIGAVLQLIQQRTGLNAAEASQLLHDMFVALQTGFCPPLPAPAAAGGRAH